MLKLWWNNWVASWSLLTSVQLQQREARAAAVGRITVQQRVVQTKQMTTSVKSMRLDRTTKHADENVQEELSGAEGLNTEMLTTGKNKEMK